MALPDTPGVHANTFSGEPSEEPHVALNVPVPLVVPAKVPPPGGMTIGLGSGRAVWAVLELLRDRGIRAAAASSRTEELLRDAGIEVVVGQLGVVTLTGALFADSFPLLSTAEMA